MTVATRDASTTSYSPATATAAGSRIQSVDIVRGIVMVLMAIDHVRVYAGVPAGGPSFGVFFTRWVTHFAAPAFVFLAGTGAFLQEQKRHDRAALSRYLLARGALLIALELTVLRLAWTFNTAFDRYNLAGVIWMLGWCMILMAGLIWLPPAAVGVTGIVIVVAQFVFGPISSMLPEAIGSFLYQGGAVSIGAGGPPILVLYVIVPWIGVMAAGYWFGRVLLQDEADRRRSCLRLGLAMTAVFVAIAGAMVLAQPAPPDAPPALFRMLNQRKYPASPLFLLMTLGPTIAFLPTAERMRGRIAGVLSTFGRVPMFYYLLHIPLIHLLALGVSVIREGHVNPWLFSDHPMNPPAVPEGYRWSLPLLYLVFATAIALLYLPCRWYASLKAHDRTGLLRYL